MFSSLELQIVNLLENGEREVFEIVRRLNKGLLAVKVALDNLDKKGYLKKKEFEGCVFYSLYDERKEKIFELWNSMSIEERKEYYKQELNDIIKVTYNNFININDCEDFLYLDTRELTKEGYLKLINLINEATKVIQNNRINDKADNKNIEKNKVYSCLFFIVKRTDLI